jgi:hypothetical protein
VVLVALHSQHSQGSVPGLHGHVLTLGLQYYLLRWFGTCEHYQEASVDMQVSRQVVKRDFQRNQERSFQQHKADHAQNTKEPHDLSHRNLEVPRILPRINYERN